MKEKIRLQKLLVVSVFAFIAFNFPILSLFNKLVFVGKMPILFVYVFGVWLVVIALTFWIMRKD